MRTRRLKFPVLIFCFLNVCMAISQTQAEQTELQKAIQAYQVGEFGKAETILLALKHSSTDAKATFRLQVLNNLGNVYADQGKNKLAISHYHQSLLIAKQNGLTLHEGQLKKNIGAVYMSLGQLKTSEEYYHAALEIATKLQHEELYADCMNNLGTIYEQTGRISLAKTSYREAISKYQQLNASANIAMVSSNLAIVYKAEQQIDSCIFYNKQALHAARRAGDKWMEAAISNNLGNVYGQNDQLNDALLHIRSGLKIAQEIQALEIEIMCYESLSDAYYAAGYFGEAYRYLKRMQERQQAFNNLSLSKEIENLRIKYQTKEKELINEQLKKEQETSRLIFIFIVLLLVVLTIVFWMVRNKRMKEANHKRVNAAIVESEAGTRLRVASDLHDNIGQKVAVLSMFLQPFTEKEPRLKGMIQDLGEQVRNVSHSLVPEAFRLGLVKALMELKVEIEQAAGIRMEISADESAFVDYTPHENLTIYRIIQEIASNSIKHSGLTVLSLEITNDASNYHIQITDNGSGFDVKTMKRSSGIGWKTIESRIGALSGTLHVRSGSSGTQTTLILPLRRI